MKTTLLCLFALAAFAFAAPPVPDYSNFATDWVKDPHVKVLPDGSCQVTSAAAFEGVKTFKVNPAKPVTITFEVRKTPESLRPLVYVGFWTFDGDRIRVQPEHVRCEYAGETAVLEDAPVGATTLRLKAPRRNPASSWKYLAAGPIKGCPVPQFDLIQLKSFKKLEDKSIEAILVKPLDKPLAAGTVFHFHGGGPGMYVAYDEKTPSDEWATVTCTVLGMQENFPRKDKRWWKGTVYAKPRIVVMQGKNNTVLFRNFRVTVAK